MRKHLIDSGVSTALTKLATKDNVASISDQICKLSSALDSG